MSTITESIEVPPSLLPELTARLTERKNVLEREVLKYGEPPSGIKEVFELCRGFERAYVTFVNESPVAGKVKECFMGEKGLAGQVKNAALEKVFELANVKKVCRYADGYQPHLVSPEKGVQALSMEALDLVISPVMTCVQAVHALLHNAAREAAEKAGEHTEAALIGTALPMYVPEFKTVIMPAIAKALDEWKSDAEKMAIMLVDMERTYITAGFFRTIMSNRFERIKTQGVGFQTSGGGGGSLQRSAPVNDRSSKDDKGKSFFPAFGGDQGKAKDDSDDEGGAKTGQAANLGNMSNDPNDFVAAFFDKSGSNIESAMAKSQPSLLSWQRRFFILSDSQKMLYYFKSPEDVPKPNGLRGQVNIGECLVDDLDDKGQPRGPGSAAPNPTDKAHWMIRLRHKDPRQSVVKDHNSMVLRADSLQVKNEWLSRLRKASGELRKNIDRPSRPPAAAEASQSTISEEGGDKSSGGPAQGPRGGGGVMTGDLSWAKEAEPILDTHLGQGAKLFRADSVRDADGRLPPAPRVFLNPMRMADRAAGTAPSFEVQYDALLEQFGSDMNMYTRMVCDTICTTVPKAVVHCLIRKSEKNLLEKLFTVIHRLTPEQMTALLKEEDSVIERRAVARKMFEDVKSAVFQVHQQAERYHMTADADRPENVVLAVNVFAYAAMPELLTKEHTAYFDKLFSDPNAPEALRFWTTPPAGSRPLPPPPAPAPQSDQPAAQGGQAGPGRPAPQPGSQAPPASQQQQPPSQQRGPPPGPPPAGMVRGPPPPGPYGGAPPGPAGYGPPPGVPARPAPMMAPGQVLMRQPPPGVPMRPAPGQPGQGVPGQPPPIVRRAPPPPPGTGR